MLFPEFKYIGLKSVLKSETGIVPLDKASFESEGELYASVYRFDSTILTHESLSNLGDNIRFYSDYLVFDFDDLESLDISLADALHLYKALRDMGAFSEVYFSGLKGFHVLVPSCQFGFEPTNDEGILKRMATILSSRYRSFDSTIYNKSRVFRVPNTVNAKSGLYKIRIPHIEDVSVSDILAAAKEPSDEIPYKRSHAYPKVELLCRLYEQAKTKINRSIQVSEPKESFGDWGIIKEGVMRDYNNTLYGMARDLARHGIFERDALIILTWWNNSHADPMDTKALHKTIKSAYTKGVNLLVTDESVFNFAYNSKKALAQVRTVYQNWDQNVVKTGYDFLDEYTLGFFKEELIFILSRPRNFKTCLLSNILHGISHATNRPCIFFSQEMSVEALTTRHIQKSEHLTQLEVLNRLKNGEDFQLFESDFKNVFVVGLSSLNTDKVITIIDKFLEEYGALGAVGFDYLSLFEGCANDTARTARMATELKTRVAKAAACPTFCLVQAKREYEGNEGDIEIDLTAGKDSSSIEDSGDYVIGTWGHWEKQPIIDDVTGETIGAKPVKKLWGRFLKARKYMSEKYPDLPYFQVNIDKAYMDVKDIVWKTTIPAFSQKKEYKE